MQDHFFPKAKKLRQVFNQEFSDPRQTDRRSFKWDYWYQKNQYKLIRTPGEHYFEPKVFDELCLSLNQWGMENLGCHSITSPWLSFYIDSCYQKLHADVPHGPFAYVLSLTENQNLIGGKTLIMKDSILNYWNSDYSNGVETNDIFHSIKPEFNRLIVFDARIPHGVSEVKNVEDPINARLVLHGWFSEPSPYVSGPLVSESFTSQFNIKIEGISKLLPQNANGFLSLQYKFDKFGKLQSQKILVNTIKSPSAFELDHLENNILELLFIDSVDLESAEEANVVIPLHIT